MAQLLLKLPFPADAAGAGAPEFDFVSLRDGVAATALQSAPAALLPLVAGQRSDVIVVLPARAVVWHRMAVPERIGRNMLAGRVDLVRLRALLTGVLEEQLLDEADQLHFAVFPGPSGAEPGMLVLWVATCGRDWLRDLLQTLERAGHSVTRVVAERQPLQEGPAQVQVCQGSSLAHMVLCTTQGVAVLPLVPDAVAQIRAQHTLLAAQGGDTAHAGAPVLFAEPALLALAERLFEQRAELQTPLQRMALAAQSHWNLAQGEWGAPHGGRVGKQLRDAWRQLARAPAWRPVRWALLVGAVLHVLALNAVAWQLDSQLQQRRGAVRQVLTDTFADVHVVVDAPVQMRRSLDALALARGVSTGPDLGQLLTVVGTLDPRVELNAIDLDNATVRLRLRPSDAVQATRLAARLVEKGWQAQAQAGVIQVQLQELQP